MAALAETLRDVYGESPASIAYLLKHPQHIPTVALPDDDEVDPTAPAAPPAPHDGD